MVTVFFLFNRLKEQKNWYASKQALRCFERSQAVDLERLDPNDDLKDLAQAE